MTPDQQKAWDAFVGVYRKWPFAFGDEETRDGVFAADDELTSLRAEVEKLSGQLCRAVNLIRSRYATTVTEDDLKGVLPDTAIPCPHESEAKKAWTACHDALGREYRLMEAVEWAIRELEAYGHISARNELRRRAKESTP